MKVLLTGGGGFIGSQVAGALAGRGHDVHAVVRASDPLSRLESLRLDVTISRADLLDRVAVAAAVRHAAPDAAVHLAWYTEPGRYLSDSGGNLDSVAATAGLFRALLDAGCARLLLGGTCLEAADISGEWPTYYAVAKRAVHDLAMSLGDDAMSVACGHVFSVYGPGEDPRRAVPSVTNALLRGQAVDVTGGTQMRDYLHVVDVADALCTVLESAASGTVDICSGDPRPMRAVFEEIGAATGRGELIRWGERPPVPSEQFDATGDPGSLAALGWAPSYSLREGIQDTVAWWAARETPSLAANEDQ